MTNYDDLLAEVRTKVEAFVKSTAKEYIRKMYSALRNENSNLSPQDARDRIEKDCCPEIWKKRTILDALPDEAKDLKKQRAGRLRQKEHNSAVPSADTVSIVIGCSFCPIAVDTHGIVRLSEALAIVRERLSKLIEECNRITGFACNTPIPDHMSWIVTMWHFGVDALTEYKGEKFFTSWEVGQHALITAYTKDWKDDKRRLRIEKQEYPKKSLADALEEKLNANCAGG